MIQNLGSGSSGPTPRGSTRMYTETSMYAHSRGVGVGEVHRIGSVRWGRWPDRYDGQTLPLKEQTSRSLAIDVNRTPVHTLIYT